MRVIDGIGGMARTLVAWLDRTPGHLPGKLYGAVCLQFAWWRGRRETAAFGRQNAAKFAEIFAPAAPARQAPPPPITRDNTLIIVAAHAPGELQVKRLTHNLRKLTAHSKHIQARDMPENLTDEAARAIRAAGDDVRPIVKTTNALLDHGAHYDALSAAAPRYDYYLLTNDSYLLVNGLDGFFRMAQEGRADYNAFSLTSETDGEQIKFIPHILLLNRAAAMAYARYCEIAAPFIESAVKNCRHHNAHYRQYYRYSLVAGVFEKELAPYLTWRALVSPAHDKRLEGANFYTDNAELFREYLEQRGHPVIKIKQINRREFAYLRSHIPDELR